MTQTAPPKAPQQPHRERVDQVFTAVADRYELANDLMSLFQHRLWRRRALALLAARPGHDVLDIAAGTCDFGLLAARGQGLWISADPNREMLRKGRRRMEAGGRNGRYVLCQAERLPLRDGSLDRILCGFGLRNFSEREQGLAELLRVLRPGGRMVVLEATRSSLAPVEAVRRAVAPLWMTAAGALATGSGAPYRYLVDSIAGLPRAEGLRQQMQDAGFCRLEAWPLAGGVASLLRGFRA